MASHLFLKLHVLIFISALCLRAGADSVLFLNTTKHPFLRPLPSITDDENSVNLVNFVVLHEVSTTRLLAKKSSQITAFHPNLPWVSIQRGGLHGDLSRSDSILLSEVAAAVSVLLGSAPSASLPPSSLSKLSQLLLSNPFDRPLAVLVLEVGGVTGQLPVIDYSKTSLGGAMIGTVIDGSHEAEIEILDEDELSVISLDAENKFDAAISDGDLDYLATWLGGSYIGSLEGMDGVLTFPLASGKSLSLHMSKEVDHNFALHLFSLVNGLEVMLKIHGDSSMNMQDKAELLQGRFTGIQALQEQYGTGSITELAMEIFLTALIKSFDTLQEAYKVRGCVKLAGQVAGVILFTDRSDYSRFRYIRSSDDNKLRYVPFRLLKQEHILVEDEAQSPSAAASALEEKLVRKTVAWITGIILLVATIIGP
ncbi:hypothetical protein ACLOJK_008013 [Asimina triloba]